MTMQKLPIEPVLPKIGQTLARRTSVVLQAPPGAGKTTLVPLALLKAPWLAGKRIIMLEPRRLATRAAARRMAYLLGQGVGQTVGYRVRMDSCVGPDTRIEVVTEGILTRYLQKDPFLEGVGLVIFDEFHERSLPADLGLALCLDVQKEVRPDLRMLVMSATMATDPVARLLGQAPVITASGRSFPVTTEYSAPSSGRTLEQNTASAVVGALKQESGNILVFLPGAPEIRRVHGLLAATDIGKNTILAPLFGTLSRREQDQAMGPCSPGMRKVVLATSIAETSLTIEGIRVVVDAGQMRVPRFDVRSAMTRLKTVAVSRASADQRRGRAGRLEPGVCYRLWSKERHDTLAPYNTPEIMEADLCPLALELAAWGIDRPETLAWLDVPPAAAFASARRLLRRLDALDEKGQVTAHGRKMADLGMHPRLAHMILKGRKEKAGSLACHLAVLLEARDIIHTRPGHWDADVRLRVEVLQAVAKNNPLRLSGIQVDMNTCRLLLKQVHHLEKRLDVPSAAISPDKAGLLLAYAYPDRIARQRRENSGHYLLANGRGAFFSDPQPLGVEEYLVVPDLDGNQQNARIYLAAPLDRETMTTRFAGQIRQVETIVWDPGSHRVTSRRQQRLDHLVISDKALLNPDPHRVTAALISGIRISGMGMLPWNKKTRAWQARVLFLHRLAAGIEKWPDVSDQGLSDTLETWLAPFLAGMSGKEHLQRVDLKGALFALLPRHQQNRLDRLAPTHLTVPSGSNIPLDYAAGDIPILAVRLQEMFGAVDTPTIAGGKVPVMLHLLSPASRPVQVTRDLANFWANTYFDVRKDLRGRYPKHYWPDNPLAAMPTGRAKPRRR